MSRAKQVMVSTISRKSPNKAALPRWVWIAGAVVLAVIVCCCGGFIGFVQAGDVAGDVAGEDPALEPMPLASGVPFMIKAITNSTYNHHGEMAFPEVTLAPWKNTSAFAPRQ